MPTLDPVSTIYSYSMTPLERKPTQLQRVNFSNFEEISLFIYGTPFDQSASAHCKMKFEAYRSAAGVRSQ